MNKNILYVILGFLAIGGTILAAPILASVLQSVTNTNTGTTNNPPPPETYMNVDVAGENVTGGQPISWGTFNVGMGNSKEVSITNKGTVAIRVFLGIPNLPDGWTQSGFTNNTIIDIGSTYTATIIITVPNTVADNQLISFDTVWQAETV